MAGACKRHGSGWPGLTGLEVIGEGGPVPVLPIPGFGGLRIVDAYKHLGRHAAGSGRMAKEVAYRCSTTAAASGALMRRVFAARGIPIGDRAHVAQACVVSRLLHGAGTWLSLSPAQLRKVQGQYMRPLRRIASHDAPPAEGARWPSAVETLGVTGQAPVQAHIAAARLRLAARITVKGTPAIQALAQSWSGARWRKVLLQDMRLMHAVLRERLRELPDPCRAPEVWEALWRKHPGAWHGLVRKMVQLAEKDPAAFLASLAACGEGIAEDGPLPAGGVLAGDLAGEVAEHATAAGVAVAAGPPAAPRAVAALAAAFAPGQGGMPGIVNAAAEDAARHVLPAVAAEAAAGQLPPAVGIAVVPEFVCAECGKHFASNRGLQCHGTHAHGRQRPSARFVVTAVCPGCGNDYRTRLRAMEHVERGSARCRAAVLEGGLGLVPHEPVVVAAADAADRTWRHQARKAGVSELAGPLARLHRGAGL